MEPSTSTPEHLAERVERVARKALARGVPFGEPLSEGAIASFEARCGSALPDGFRAFIRQIGNGGHGPPSYGLLPLGQLPHDLTGDEARSWVDLQRVRHPFPFTHPWIWEDGDSSREGMRKQVEDGSLHLGTDGCGQYWLLIVNGPERGNVWMVADVGITPTTPKRDFLQWYEDWLDGVRDWWE